MKTHAVLLFSALVLFSFSTVLGQTDSLASFDENESDFRMTVGASGGFTFVNPGMLNDELAFINNSLDANMEKVTSMAQFAAYVRIKPRMAPYMFMRLEALTVSRSFDYQAQGRSASGASTGLFNTTTATRWTVYPFVVGIGSTIPKTPIDAEVGLIYAMGFVTEKVSTDGYGSSTNTSSANSFGLQGRVSPRFRISKNAAISIEVSYRFLTIKNYSDDLGRAVQNFELYLDGLSMALGVSYNLE